MFIGFVVLFAGVLHLVALHKKWGWYMNNWQSTPMREQFGETGFAVFTYAVCTACIVFGFMTIFNLPFPMAAQ